MTGGHGLASTNQLVGGSIRPGMMQGKIAMKKYSLALLGLLGLVTTGQADLIWSTPDLVAGGIPDIDANSDGWLVQMYHDVNGDSILSELAFNSDGTPGGMGNSADDVLLASFTSSLEALTGPPPDEIVTVNFGETYTTFSTLHNQSVYTVILDASGWHVAQAGVNRTFVLDAERFVLTGSEEQVYAVPSDNPGEHEWTMVIPEPGTILLMALGGCGLMALRNRRHRLG